VDRSLPAAPARGDPRGRDGVLRRHGYQNADIEVLAEEIGIGKGTIYRYFPTKDRLFRSALQRGLDALHATIAVEKHALHGHGPGDGSTPSYAR
jgi:AcrR family transcriptional regulator